MSSIVREVDFSKAGPDVDLVEMLEQWTELARSGELLAVCVAGVKRGNVITTEWRGGWLHHLISAVAILKHRILASSVEP